MTRLIRVQFFDRRTKVSPEQVAQAVLNGFAHDQLEMWIGKTKALRMIHRLSPAFAQRLMRHR